MSTFLVRAEMGWMDHLWFSRRTQNEDQSAPDLPRRSISTLQIPGNPVRNMEASVQGPRAPCTQCEWPPAIGRKTNWIAFGADHCRRKRFARLEISHRSRILCDWHEALSKTTGKHVKRSWMEWQQSSTQLAMSSKRLPWLNGVPRALLKGRVLSRRWPGLCQDRGSVEHRNGMIRRDGTLAPPTANGI